MCWFASEGVKAGRGERGGDGLGKREHTGTVLVGRVVLVAVVAAAVMLLEMEGLAALAVPMMLVGWMAKVLAHSWWTA